MPKPIPDGFHTVTPSLAVKDAPKAIDWYVEAFGATDRGRFADPAGTIMHAEIMIGDSIVMLAEEMPMMGTRGPATLGGTCVSLCIYTTDADALFERATTAGATVLMPLSDQFWGDRYGVLADPFGHHWSIATHTRDVSMEEMKKASVEMFAQPSA
jgi:PhnB protein